MRSPVDERHNIAERCCAFMLNRYGHRRSIAPPIIIFHRLSRLSTTYRPRAIQDNEMFRLSRDIATYKHVFDGCRRLLFARCHDVLCCTTDSFAIEPLPEQTPTHVRGRDAFQRAVVGI